jgi:ABC-type branched-subunit amino acid transport system permease subunit
MSEQPPEPGISERPEEDDRPRIGVDEWVASVDDRREQVTGISGRIKETWRRLPPIGRLAVFVVPAVAFPFFGNTGDIYRYGVITLIYAVLALGLNIVVGYAGLLDLGFVAFFGFGAYTYGVLASGHSGNHWQAELAVPLAVGATALLGVIIGLPSRRLVGDYLAIVTLFFGQAFVIFVNNANRINFPLFGHVNLTGGSAGIESIDPLVFFGWKADTTRELYFISLAAFILVISVSYLVNTSRTGRGWRALREDSLAAEAMSIPVRRLKLMAFGFGAGVAGLVGCIYASVQTLAAPGDYDVALLITIYAILILGGLGSLEGIVVAALIINGVPELLRNPDNGRWVFYGAILIGLALMVRPFWRFLAVIASTIVFGFVVHGIADLVWERGTAGQPFGSGRLADAAEKWMLLPDNPVQIANFAYVALIAAVIVLTRLRGTLRLVALVPTLYLAGFVWENLLLENIVGPTRLILLGALLVVLMAARPQGLFGERRVEIV